MVTDSWHSDDRMDPDHPPSDFVDYDSSSDHSGEEFENESGFSMNKKGELYKSVITSKLLISKGTQIEDSFINENLHEDIDHSWLNQKKSKKSGRNGYHKGNIPNFYIGSSRGNIHEVFEPKQTIFLKFKDHDDPLKISVNDLQKFTKPGACGGFGNIYFLKNIEFENDHLSKDNNRRLKKNLIVKKQTRITKFGTNQKGNMCFAFNELTNFLFNSLRTDEYYSDQEVYHFYAPAIDDPTKLELFIVMKRCELMLDELIDIVHGNSRKKRNFKSNKKFPTIILKNLIHTFFTQGGGVHNDIKGGNIGYIIRKDGTVICRFIDFGSKNGSGEIEPDGAKYSKFPGTILFLSPNKAPKLGTVDFILEEDVDMSKSEEFDEVKANPTLLETTCKRALPNYNQGAGDNLWAIAILILECIFGVHPAIEYGLFLDDVFRCID